MKVLIVGGGGREHALAWKCAASPLTDKIFVAPGNAGTANEPNVENVPLGVHDLDGLRDFARTNEIDLTIVGPEAPLVAGLVDHFEAAGLKVFGPSAAAAQLEGSKAFTKSFLTRHRIPTARWESFGDSAEALRWLEQVGAPIVIKADGLAAGKGVILADTQDQAEAAIRDMLDDASFGDAGATIVMEEFLRGEEASFICIVDGTDVVPLASSQDHKARDDGDIGPNTGGMGAYSPAPVVTDAMHERIMRDVIRPTVDGMVADGLSFRGFLYAGLMIAADGTPNVLEFNVRLGDPETQPLLLRLRSDLVELCLAAVDGSLASMSAVWDPRPALGVVMAAGGYPEGYAKGDTISGIDEASAHAKVFHAGTALEGEQILTAGGRVLCVTALGDTVKDAQRTAYQGCAQIDWRNCYYRRDIGHRAIARE